jgi:hypothetical protein
MFLLVLAPFALLSPGTAAGQIASAQSAFSLVVSVPKTTAKVGEDLKVEINITNISDHDILYDASGREPPFGLEVRDSGGRDIPRTTQGRRALAFEGSVFASPLHPGESVHRERLANKDFELTSPGKYLVQGIRMASKTTAVRSNVVEITILP